MATVATSDDAPRVVGDIIALHADEIDASERLRPIDLDWAAGLGRIMLRDGQDEPIKVCLQMGRPKKWKLVAGGHRHMAATLLPEINPLHCIEVDHRELARRRAEIAENLHRRDLDPIDRATFIAEMHDVLRAEAGLSQHASAQSIAANARWKKDLRVAAGDASEIVARAYGFTAEIAETLKLSKRSIELDLMLARRLAPSAREQLRGHPVANNATQLRALAKLDTDEQLAVVARLLFAGAKSVADALAQLRDRPKASAEDRRLSAFIGSYARMTITEKKGALAQLAGMLPAGWRLAKEDSDAR